MLDLVNPFQNRSYSYTNSSITIAAETEKFSDYLERLYLEGDARSSSSVVKKFVERILSYLKGGHNPKCFLGFMSNKLIDFQSLILATS